MEDSFLADAMLGRLARWLRLMGFDVEYYPGSDRDRLVSLSRYSSRQILTKRRRPPVPGALIIRGNRVEEQLRSFFTVGNFRLERNKIFTRCSLCNSPLTRVGREEVSSKGVPEHIIFSSTGFTMCETCGRIYWPGSHRRRFLEKLEKFDIPGMENKGGV